MLQRFPQPAIKSNTPKTRECATHDKDVFFCWQKPVPTFAMIIIALYAASAAFFGCLRMVVIVIVAIKDLQILSQT